MRRFNFGKKKEEEKGLMPVENLGLGSFFGADDIFEKFFKGPFFGLSLLKGYKEPAVDIYEKDNSLVVKAELPGLDKKDIKINIENDILTISGTRKAEREVKKENFYHVERSYGSINRAVRIPEGTSLKDVKAAYKDGVLTVTMPVTEKAKEQGRSIDIE